MSETLLQDETELAPDAGDVQLEIGIPSEAHELAIEYVDRALVSPDPDQPRAEADAELKASIAAEGIRLPIQVRPHPERLGEYMIIDGERRWRGSEGLMDRVPVIVRRDHDDEARRLIGQLTSNTGKPLAPIEEARAYHRLLSGGITQADLARQLGVPRTTIGDRARLMELGPWIPLIEDGTISISLATAHLVPIRSVPETIQAEIVEKFREWYKSSFSDADEDVEAGLISDLGFSFEGWLREKIGPFCYPITKTSSHWEKQPEFDVRKHDAECDCGGAMLELRDSRRKYCTNPEWWRPLLREARKVTRAKEEKKEGKAESLPRWARLPEGAKTRKEKYYYNPRAGETAIVKRGKWNVSDVHFDPDVLMAQLTPDSLVRVVSGYGDGAGDKITIVTTDKKAIAAAKASYAERAASHRKALVEKRATQLQKLIGNADFAVRGDGTSTLLALIANAYSLGELVDDAAELLEIDRGKGGARDEPSARARWVRALEPRLASKVATTVVIAIEQEWGTIEHGLSRFLASEDSNLANLPIKWPGSAPNAASSSKPSKAKQPAVQAELACIQCGCTEDSACAGGCAWLVVDKKRNIGVCSSCAEDKAEARTMLKVHAAEDEG